MNTMNMKRKKTGRMIGIVILLATLVSAPLSAADRLLYTALGDSLAFGALAPPFKGYAYLFRGAIATDTGAAVLISNLGVPGWTSGDLRSALESNFFFQLSVAKSKVVTWNIGGNDLRAARSSYKAGTCGGLDNQDCLKTAVAVLKANWDAIIVRLLALRQETNPVSRTMIRTMDIYNPYVTVDKNSDSWASDGGLVDFDVFKIYLEDVNNYIATTASSNDIPCAKVYEAFNGMSGEDDPIAKGYIAFDGFHPNGRGHAKIAELLEATGYCPLFLCP